MIFLVQYTSEVVREDIPKLSSDVKEQIKTSIEKKLRFKPEHFGKPLRKSLKGYRKLRVGDYRVIFRIEDELVKIFAIGHRSVIYRDSERRLK